MKRSLIEAHAPFSKAKRKGGGRRKTRVVWRAEAEGGKGKSKVRRRGKREKMAGKFEVDCFHSTAHSVVAGSAASPS